MSAIYPPFIHLFERTHTDVTFRGVVRPLLEDCPGATFEVGGGSGSELMERP